MDHDGLDHDVMGQWQVVLQLLSCFICALLWFRDGMVGVWADVTTYNYWLVGPWLTSQGLSPTLGASEEERLPGVVTVAALHTLVAVLGVVIGNSLKHFFTRPVGVVVGSATTLAFGHTARLWLSDSYERQRWGVKVIAGHMRWPVGNEGAAEHFGAIGAASLVVWFGSAMAVAAVDTRSRGIVPTVVARYVPHAVGFYCLSIFFFHFACVPLWNSLARFSVLLGGRIGVEVEPATDLTTLTELASVTHTLTLLLGVSLCSMCNRVLSSRTGLSNLAVLTGLTAAFFVVIGQWVRFALGAQVLHVVHFATVFFGEKAVTEAAAAQSWTAVHTLLSASYASWFASGVVFEQCWQGSSSNYPTDGRRLPSSPGQVTVSAKVLVMAVVLILFPAAWLTGVVGMVAAAFLLWPVSYTPKSGRRIPTTPPDAYKKVSWAAATSDCPRTGDQYLVIGVGFVGVRLIHRLLERGETRIRAFDVTPNNPFAGDARVQYIQGNVCKVEDLVKACNGVDTVYATFAVIRFWERMQFQAALSIRVNIDGTRNLLEAVKRCGVKRLVQTSSSHVIATPGYIHMDMDESSPYVPREVSHNHYSWTKAEAEKMVLAANGVGGCITAAVRPCSGVFGANDRTLCERFLRQRVLVMPAPECILDYIYVDNVVLGHLKCEARMLDSPAKVGGLSFNISNDEPVTFENLGIAIQHYYGPGLIRLAAPLRLFHLICQMVEVVHWASGNRITLGADLGIATPATLITGTMPFTVKSGPGSRARDVLNYKPAFTFDEAIQQTIHDWRAANEQPKEQSVREPSVRRSGGKEKAS